jgi:hypothetical protein
MRILCGKFCENGGVGSLGEIKEAEGCAKKAVGDIRPPVKLTVSLLKWYTSINRREVCRVKVRAGNARRTG